MIERSKSNVRKSKRWQKTQPSLPKWGWQCRWEVILNCCKILLKIKTSYQVPVGIRNRIELDLTRHLDGRMNWQTDGWTDGQTDRQLDGQHNYLPVCINHSINITTNFWHIPAPKTYKVLKHVVWSLNFQNDVSLSILENILENNRVCKYI